MLHLAAPVRRNQRFPSQTPTLLSLGCLGQPLLCLITTPTHHLDPAQLIARLPAPQPIAGTSRLQRLIDNTPDISDFSSSIPFSAFISCTVSALNELNLRHAASFHSFPRLSAPPNSTPAPASILSRRERSPAACPQLRRRELPELYGDGTSLTTALPEVSC